MAEKMTIPLPTPEPRVPKEPVTKPKAAVQRGPAAAPAPRAAPKWAVASTAARPKVPVEHAGAGRPPSPPPQAPDASDQAQAAIDAVSAAKTAADNVIEQAVKKAQLLVHINKFIQYEPEGVTALINQAYGGFEKISSTFDIPKLEGVLSFLTQYIGSQGTEVAAASSLPMILKVTEQIMCAMGVDVAGFAGSVDAGPLMRTMSAIVLEAGPSVVLPAWQRMMLQVGGELLNFRDKKEGETRGQERNTRLASFVDYDPIEDESDSSSDDSEDESDSGDDAEGDESDSGDDAMLEAE